MPRVARFWDALPAFGHPSSPKQPGHGVFSDTTRRAQASVYNVTAKNWITEAVDDIEQGKDRAAAHTRAYLQKAGNLELPPLEWRKSRSA